MTRNKALSVGKPILFNTEMVKAILDGRKTVTRRVLKNQDKYAFAYSWEIDENGEPIVDLICDDNVEKYVLGNKPPCDKGDIIYVRETWCKYDDDHVIDGVRYAYKADATPVSEETRKSLGYKWKPSIHMPKEAARIFLRVTDVRVERLQDITVSQSTKEGCVPPCSTCQKEHKNKCVGGGLLLRECPIDRIYSPFIGIWNTTVKESDLDRYGWEANPWVWVIEFEKIEVTERVKVTE